MKKQFLKLFSLIFIFTIIPLHFALGDNLFWLSKINDKPEEFAIESIYSKEEVLYCTGENPAANNNNKAADLMLEGNYTEAEKFLSAALKKAPLFFPFRYNIGICYIYLNKLDHALIHLQKAGQIIPEYYKVNLQIGYIYSRKNQESLALDNFRAAQQKNPKDLNILTIIGDLYFERNQLSAAQNYYKAVLSINKTFPNGLLGLAKIHFINEEYIKAIVLLKSIDTTRDYDKSLHYYFAESSYKTGDYANAVMQYEELLKHRQNRFFLTNSVLLINHKLDIARQFIDR